MRVSGIAKNKPYLKWRCLVIIESGQSFVEGVGFIEIGGFRSHNFAYR
jgi:hypothetical protein